MKKSTIYTIAEEAGVSVSTVSNILNHRTGNYSLQIEKKVQKIAERQGYQRKTKIIKLITPILKNEVPEKNIFHVKMRDGIRKVCEQRKYQLQEVNVMNSEFDQRIQEIIHQDDCDGILLVGSILNREQIALISASKMPHVIIDNGICGQEHNSISINNESTSFALTELLIRNHHRNIGFVGTFSQINNYRERENGFRQAMNYYNIEHRRIYDIPALSNGTIDREKLQIHLKKLMQTKNPPTAYCAANDYCAYFLLEACEKLGIRMSVTGFDNVKLPNPFEDYLTTATIHSDQLGIVAVERLFQLIENPHQTPTKILVSTELIERKSIYKNY